jgi:hypothetical protein
VGDHHDHNGRGSLIFDGFVIDFYFIDDYFIRDYFFHEQVIDNYFIHERIIHESCIDNRFIRNLFSDDRVSTDVGGAGGLGADRFDGRLLNSHDGPRG